MQGGGRRVGAAFVARSDAEILETIPAELPQPMTDDAPRAHDKDLRRTEVPISVFPR
jgi:hypothetical protein